MNSTVETLEDNKVKVSVTVEETEFEGDLDAAFKRIAQEVNLPGFRRGKAPRKLLEARIGLGPAREEALREALPKYYSDAVIEHDVDVIAPPELDITGGQDEGPVTFEAIVEVRPVISIAGYDGLKVTMPSPEPDAEEIDAQIDRMRSLDATVETVDRAADEGDTVVIDIVGTLDGEEQDGLTTDDYNYEIGSGVITSEVDEQLNGASAGDELDFDATHPDEDEERQLHFVISVKEVKAKVLPELTDEWAQENSEFETVDEMKADLVERMTTVRKAQGAQQLQEKVAEALAALVTDDLPEALISGELNGRLQDLGMRLQAQGMGLEQYLMMTGRSQEQLIDELRENAETSARVDLALRAIVVAEGIECTDDELDAEIDEVAERVGEKPKKVRAQLEQNDQLPAVRSDITKRKALEWLLDHVEIVDENGNNVDRSTYEPPADDATDTDTEEDAAE
ncbi:trigger factor [Actinospongicola halichondriae]|uniref:trigger factor n=1 Tax=Actinospongicola halichondriae TaxID=3236844 RepID=UPI003D536BD8